MKDANLNPEGEPRGLRNSSPETSLSSLLFPERFFANNGIGLILLLSKVSNYSSGVNTLYVLSLKNTVIWLIPEET